MKAQIATGFVPYEIGDMVKLKKGDTIWEVKDIRITQYVASGKAEVYLLLLDKFDGTKIWREPDKIEKRIFPSPPKP